MCGSVYSTCTESIRIRIRVQSVGSPTPLPKFKSKIFFRNISANQDFQFASIKLSISTKIRSWLQAVQGKTKAVHHTYTYTHTTPIPIVIAKVCNSFTTHIIRSSDNTTITTKGLAESSFIHYQQELQDQNVVGKAPTDLDLDHCSNGKLGALYELLPP